MLYVITLQKYIAKDKLMPEPQKTEKDTKKNETPKKKKGVKHLIISTIFVLLLGFAAFILWKNPTLLSSFNSKKTPHLSTPTVTDTTDRDVEDITDRLSYLEKQHSRLMEVKADKSQILDIADRLNNIESKASRIMSFNNDMALVLTSAVLIKEEAEQGENFDQEISVLEQIIPQQMSLSKEVEQIKHLSQQNIKTTRKLISEFKGLHEKAIEEEKERTPWLDRIKNKLKEIFVIRRTDIKEEPKPLTTKEILEKEALLIEDGYVFDVAQNISQASFEEKPLFEQWIKDVQNKKDLQQALSKIISQALLEMKSQKN